MVLAIALANPIVLTKLSAMAGSASHAQSRWPPRARGEPVRVIMPSTKRKIDSAMPIMPSASILTIVTRSICMVKVTGAVVARAVVAPAAGLGAVVGGEFPQTMTFPATATLGINSMVEADRANLFGATFGNDEDEGAVAGAGAVAGGAGATGGGVGGGPAEYVVAARGR